MTRKGKSSHKQESAPLALKKNSSSHRSVEGGTLTPVTSNHRHRPHRPVATEECSTERSKSESGWHMAIQNKDWISLQRYLEQLSSPPIPQLPRESHNNAYHDDLRRNSKSPPRDKNKTNKPRRSTSLSWLKRSVASMGNMSGRTHNAIARLSSDSQQQQEAIEEHEDEDHSGTDPLHLDKESLLVRNPVGRTPLQLALNAPEATDPMVLHLLRAQPKAASLLDTKGRLPLHFAVVRKRRMETIAELVELYPEALHQQDEKGKTPVAYAIEMAKRQTNLQFAPRTFWASLPVPEEDGPEAIWQKTQHEQWEMARWLLQTSACLHHYNNHAHRQQSAAKAFRTAAGDHQHPFLIRNGAQSQQPVLIEAMLHAAPPTVVVLLVEASSELFTETDEEEEYRNGITSIACSAFYLAVFRQYPLAILKQLGSLLENLREVKTVRDETGLGLVSAHYVTSCFEKSKLLEYVAEEEFMVTVEQCIVEGHLPEDNIPFLEWWGKLKYLIFFCADKNPDHTSDDYLLHAALENADTPPNVIRLLLALYPGSARQPDAHSAHPLHLFAKHRDYIPRNYESPYMHGLNVMDMLLSLDESSVFHQFQRRLPLHHAIASGRTWPTIHPMISSYRSSLRMPDPITKLYPCQLAAAYREDNIEEEMTRLLQLTRNQYSAIVWQGLSHKQQKRAVERIRHFESLKRLDTIFELFRRYPQCVETAIASAPRQSKKKKSPVVEKEKAVAPEAVNEDNGETDKEEQKEGPEMITFHYLSWCYNKVGSVWRVVPENMELLQASIQVAAEHRVLSQKSADFVNWWGMLKMYFWHCYSATDVADKVAIPRDDNYLLHAAVSIPTTPPDLIELILGLHPESASTPLRGSFLFPLHLACKTTTYTPQYFEIAQQESTLELVLEEFPEAVFARSSQGQTPLHIAIQAGKPIDEILPLIEQGPSLVWSRDPVSGLFPYQVMAVSKPLTSDLRLRFRTLAANRHSKEWSKFSGQRKMKEIRTVEKEYQMRILDSVFELLRLAPAAISPSGLPESGQSKPSSRAPMRRRGSGGSLVGLDSCASSAPKPIPAKGRKKGFRRVASARSRDSSVGSAFSTIDMMSTISNVSSHLSFRRASSMSDGKPSASMLGEEDSDESEDSDIFSEDASFQEDDNEALEKKVVKEAENGQQDAQISSGQGSEEARKSVHRQKLKSGWQGPAHFGAENSPAVEATPAGRKSIPKVIVQQPDVADIPDDISYLDNINPRSRSGRSMGSLRRSLMGDSLSSDDDNDDDGESLRDSCIEPEDLKVEEPQTVSDDDNPQARRRSTFPIESADAKETDEEEADSSEISPAPSNGDDNDDRKQPKLAVQPAPIPTEAKESEDSGIDDSVHDEIDDSIHDEIDESIHDEIDESIHDQIIPSVGQTPKDGEPEEPVVVFRLRKTSCQRTRDPMPRKGRSVSLGGSRQSKSGDMDFLSILNASLPEGKMDYLSTLGVSSGSLPPGSGSLPTGLDAPPANFKSMARIEEFPGESEHSAVSEQRSRETGNVARRATVATLPSHQPKLSLSPPSTRGALKLSQGSPGSARASPYSPQSQNSRRRTSLEINTRTSNYIGVKPEKLKSCLLCATRGREVLVLPCSHLSVCRVCAIEEEIKSCPICFGPVTDKKVAA